MPNGKPGDHPVTDLLEFGHHRFPADIEALILAIHSLEPADARSELWSAIFEKAWNWERRNLINPRAKPDPKILEQDRQWLHERLRQLEEKS
jgi:hypothetical protein